MRIGLILPRKNKEPTNPKKSVSSLNK